MINIMSDHSYSAKVSKTSSAQTKKCGGRYCCVVGCTNNQKRSIATGIKFYKFPKDPGRKLKWEKAIKRQDSRRSGLWSATPYSVICSAHFAGGKKSDDVESPAFAPSLFPTHTTRSETIGSKCRSQRLKMRQVRDGI